MMLRVIYLPNAEKYFRKLKDKSLKDKFKETIINVRNKPEIGEAKTGDLSGIYSVDLYHNKIN